MKLGEDSNELTPSGQKRISFVKTNNDVEEGTERETLKRKRRNLQGLIGVKHKKWLGIDFVYCHKIRRLKISQLFFFTGYLVYSSDGLFKSRDVPLFNTIQGCSLLANSTCR